MSRPAECYAQAMLELQYPMDVVEQAQAIWECCPALSEALTNPTISIPEKEAVVRKVFPEAVQNLLCVLCKNAETADVPEIFQAFYEKKRQSESCVHAVVECHTAYRSPAGRLETVCHESDRQTAGSPYDAEKSSIAGRFCIANR